MMEGREATGIRRKEDELTESCAVEFCFDYASPWTYIADLRVEEALAGLPVEIHYTPVYLRGFEMFRSGMPFTSAKLSYIVKDLQRCAAFYEVPLNMPRNFPINGLHLLRATLFLQDRPEFDAYRKAAYRATWVDDRNVSDPAVALEIGVELGLDGGELSAGSASAAVKERLRANTEGAIERGAFGVPTFFVGEELFWGQDRLDFVRREVERSLPR
jgi:2-hydroxychromene-2-carboxylate isomerase